MRKITVEQASVAAILLAYAFAEEAAEVDAEPGTSAATVLPGALFALDRMLSTSGIRYEGKNLAAGLLPGSGSFEEFTFERVKTVLYPRLAYLSSEYGVVVKREGVGKECVVVEFREGLASLRR